MVLFCPLASGSRGNALFIGTENTKILVDVGISARNLGGRLAELHMTLEDLDAIIISHEHHDHIAGLKSLAFARGIPVIANLKTAQAISSAFGECPKFKIFSTGETFEFQDLEITPFSVKHDAVDPVGFSIAINGIKIGIATDLGQVTSQVVAHLANSRVLYVEANHEPSLVAASKRPYIYKERVLSPLGHLSNEECGRLLDAIWHPELRHVSLAHLSSECNHPHIALRVIQEILGEKKESLDLAIAWQDKKSPHVQL
jgi:phosphoribosyl 1,2-cyclic phosphodiesterase